MKRRTPEHHILYLNGLERTGVGRPEKLLQRYLATRGVQMTHAEVDWHSGQHFEDLYEETYTKAEELLRKHGRLALVGASAGGSLAVNTFHGMRWVHPRQDISVISLSGRLQVGDEEHLRRTALHRPARQISPAYIESVVHCEQVALPLLTDSDKAQIRTVKPLADRIVPPATMQIEGVNGYTVPAAGHVNGIVAGAMGIPRILDEIDARSLR